MNLKKEELRINYLNVMLNTLTYITQPTKKGDERTVDKSALKLIEACEKEGQVIGVELVHLTIAARDLKDFVSELVKSVDTITVPDCRKGETH